MLSAVPAVLADEGSAADENPFTKPPPVDTKAAEAEPETEAAPLQDLKNRSPFERWFQQREGSTKDRSNRGSLHLAPVGRASDKSQQKLDPLLPGKEFPRVGPILDDPLHVKLPTLPNPPPMEDRVEPEMTPSQLKKLTEILPFRDYEPDKDVRKDDPCKYLCPRPDGKPCKPLEPGATVPDCPKEVSLAEGTYEGRSIEGTVFNWEASNLYHNPLYFEDAPLERYGHTHHEIVQPFVSAGKFGVQLLGLPYQMTIDPICKRMYALGWYRPGDRAPYKHYQIPWNTHAAAVEGGFMTGMFFLIP